ncbi:spindle pole body component 110 isoform X2 [Agrilus planipennis]|uniref:Spindle pole body component 110 isoform X2 n=1 Tax=Agrilus planipennis TaxID=224129 RepID=A0A7F5RAU8_AGRPL|nr:spindle pole body component 110 isoform X2 [Agrilus planipennis]
MKKEFIEQTKKDFEEELKQLKSDNMTIKEKYETSLIELEKAIKEKEMREEKMKELGCAIQQCEEYQKKYEKGLAEIKKINREKEEHEKKIKELEQSLKGFEESKTKYAESVKEIDNLRAKATQATFEFQEELKLAGRKGQPDYTTNEEKENLRRKAMVALEANNNLQVQCLKKLEEKMKEIYILKRQIENLEGKELAARESNSNEERCLKEKEISNLKDCIKQLEGGQACTKLANESLQTMVNNYRKSVAELEETEKHLRTEISQQNITILNLQEALLAAKQELEEIRQKAAKEIYKRVKIMNSLYTDLVKVEEEYSSSSKECENLSVLLNNLRDDYLDLEVENFNHLQDIEMLDCLVLKYQQINKLNEKIANTSNLDMENKTLAGNLIDAQAINNVLQEQLKVAETQLAYEMKMNKHYITLTEELQDKLSSETVKNHRIQQKVKEIQFQLEKSNSFVRSLENTVKDLESTIIIYERDLEMGRKREKQQDKEIEIYRKQLRDISDKFMDLDEKYKELEAELEIKNRSMLEKENKIKQDYEERERVRADLGQQLTYAKEELGGLRIEMNKTITAQNALRLENEKLKTQLNTLHVDRNSLEQQVVDRTQEVEQYLQEIQNLQADKETTEQKYKILKTELQGLQSAFDNLSKQYMNKAESLISLEMELVDTKSSHTQLCNESKKVVDNVRCWLEEQKEINLKLERNIKEKESTINKLKGEIRNLKCHLTLPNKLPTTYERRPTHPLIRTSLMQALSPTHPWSLGSQGSESSYSTNPAEGDEETATSDIDTTESWLYRVESMTEQLQRSNNYWKNRIHDHEYMVTRDQ